MHKETERLIIRSIESADEEAFVEMASDGSLHDIFGECGDCRKLIGSWIREAQAACSACLLSHCDIPGIIAAVRDDNTASHHNFCQYS